MSHNMGTVTVLQTGGGALGDLELGVEAAYSKVPSGKPRKLSQLPLGCRTPAWDIVWGGIPEFRKYV